MRNFIDIIENAQALPSWFTSGKITSVVDLESYDASEFLDGDEFDYEWRLCRVPISVLPAVSIEDLHAKFAPYDRPGFETEKERIESIQGWFAHGVDEALSQRPLVVLLTSTGEIRLLDGWHRTAVARTMGLQNLMAVVGLGDPHQEDAFDETTDVA